MCISHSTVSFQATVRRPAAAGPRTHQKEAVGGAACRRPPFVYLPSQTLTFAWLAFTHCSAALAGSMCFPAIRLATKFWSSEVHFQRLITPTAGEPLFANFVEITLSMIVSPY